MQSLTLDIGSPPGILRELSVLCPFRKHTRVITYVGDIWSPVKGR
jgi:hypothetical protein